MGLREVWRWWVLGHMLVCTGHKPGVAVEGVGSLANRGAGNTRKSGFYIERGGRDGVRMG